MLRSVEHSPTTARRRSMSCLACAQYDPNLARSRRPDKSVQGFRYDSVEMESRPPMAAGHYTPRCFILQKNFFETGVQSRAHRHCFINFLTTSQGRCLGGPRCVGSPSRSVSSVARGKRARLAFSLRRRQVNPEGGNDGQQEDENDRRRLRMTIARGWCNAAQYTAHST